MQSMDKHIYKWFQKIHMLEISFWKWKYFHKSIWHLRAKNDLQQPQVAMPNICAAIYPVCHLCQSNPATQHRKPRPGLRTQTAEPQSPELGLSTGRLLLGSLNLRSAILSPVPCFYFLSSLYLKRTCILPSSSSIPRFPSLPCQSALQRASCTHPVS